jgi:hypothetical protein
MGKNFSYMDLTYQAIEKYLSAFDAAQYRVQIAHSDGKKYPPLNFTYSPEQMVKSIGYLKSRNLLGYHIYARPIGYRFILLDDLKREMLAELATVRPCLLMETSPGNYQAFLTLAQEPANRNEAKNACLQICQQFNGDKASADPDHVGRLPGFTNRKEKYRNEKGLYPFVKLHRSEKRLTTFLPKWGRDGQITPATGMKSLVKPAGLDRSRQDFNTACMLIMQKKPDEYIRQVLLSQSSKAQERGEKYVDLTISNARKKLSL